MGRGFDKTSLIIPSLAALARYPTGARPALAWPGIVARTGSPSPEDRYKARMHSRISPRNRLAKVLPQEWRTFLQAHGVPKRKYTAVCRATLADGRVIDDLIIEEGWIVALTRAHLSGPFEQRIDFDPRSISELLITQVA